MDVKVERKFEVTIKLDRDEAQWLLSLMRAPLAFLSEVNKKLEAGDNKKYRKRFYDSLQGHGIISK